MRSCVVMLGLTVVLSAAFEARAGEWGRFRGPNGTGIASDADLPLTLAEGASLEWALEVPFGRSSPVVGAEAIYLTAAGEDGFSVLAVETSTGKLRWAREVDRARVARMHTGNDSASPSPVTDGSNVFAFFQESGLVSFDAEGVRRWHLPLGPFTNYHGMGSSPILGGGLVLLLCDQSFGSFLLAVDAEKGEVRWRTERPGREDAWSTPVLYPSAESPEAVLVAGSRWVDAYDLESGEPLWSLGGFGASTVPSPVIADGRLFVSAVDVRSTMPTSFERFAGEHDKDGDGILVAAELAGVPTYGDAGFGYFDVDGDGRLTEKEWEIVKARLETTGWGSFGMRLRGTGDPPEILWNHRRNVGFMPSAIVVNGVFFGASGSILTSLDAATGAVHKRGRLVRSGDLWASPVAAGDRLYFAMLDGRLVVISAEPEWEVLQVNDVGEAIYATPAIADHRLVVRTEKRLLSFATPDPPSQPGP